MVRPTPLPEYLEVWLREARSLAAYSAVRAYRTASVAIRMVAGDATERYGHLPVERALEGAGGWDSEALGSFPVPFTGTGQTQRVTLSRAMTLALALGCLLWALKAAAGAARSQLERLADGEGPAVAAETLQAAGGWDVDLMGADPLRPKCSSVN